MRNSTKPLLVVTLLGALIATAAASLDRYVEDFTTTAKKHPSTTADWNTAAGELRLFPFALTEIGNAEGAGVVGFGMAIDGDYLFGGDNGAKLTVFNISNPAAPYAVTSYGPAGLPAWRPQVQGDHLFFAVGNSMEILNIANPSSPTLAGSLSLNTPYDVAVDGDLAYVADASIGLTVVDVTNVAAPFLIGSHATPIEAVEVAGDHAFASSSAFGFFVYSIQNPASPTVVGTLGGAAYGRTALAGSHAYASTAFGMRIIDVQDPTNPTLVSTYADEVPYDIAVAGDRAYLVNNTGLVVVDISDPTSPTHVATLPLANGALAVAVSGHRAYVGTDVDDLVHVIDVAGLLTTPILDASVATTGATTRNIAVSGDRAYVAGVTGGLDIFDVSDPIAPVLLANAPAANAVWDVAIAGDRAYLAGGTAGLRVYDITNPAAPSLLASLPVTDDNFGVALHGNYAYLAVDVDGVRAINITNPAAPVDVGGANTPGFATQIAIAGNYAYVADGPGHVQVLNITNPAAPSIAGSSATGFVTDVAVSGDYAFTTDPGGDFGVLSIVNPTSPTSAATLPMPGAGSVAIDGDVAYVVAGGLVMVDISTPASPVMIGKLPLSGGAQGLAKYGNHVFFGGDSPVRFNVASVVQSAFNTTKNIGVGYLSSATSDPVLGVSLLAAYTDSIKWDVRAGGGSWIPTIADGRLVHFPTPTTGSVQWRSTHLVADPLVNPTCTEVDITLLHCYPQIESIVDVGHDQGNQVRITWIPSGNDNLASPDQTVEYSIYRKVKPGFAFVAKTSGRTQAEAALANWDHVLTMPADGDSRYSAVVPTVADSTATGPAYFTFLVRARTAPGVFCDSPPDSGFSADNIAPYGPSGFVVNYNVGSNLLTWNAVNDADVAGYRVYHGVTPNFVVEPQAIAVETAQTSWLDTSDEAWKYFYKLVTFDSAGNESTPIGPALVTGTPGGAPTVFALRQNTPNPFNAGTVIPYDLPSENAGRVTVHIYDVAGREVRSLVDERPPGTHFFRWDGRDAGGAGVSSGVYFYRLEAGSASATRKMVLLK